jgi:hypothetical membrane protein
MRHVRLITVSTLAFLCTVFTLLQLLDKSMYTTKSVLPLIFGSLVTAQNATVDLKWYAPKKSWINDLGEVLNGTGTHGFIFNSSEVPAGTLYGTYNWCNMPHVRAQEYSRVSEEYELMYVEV